LYSRTVITVFEHNQFMYRNDSDSSTKGDLHKPKWFKRNIKH